MHQSAASRYFWSPNFRHAMNWIHAIAAAASGSFHLPLKTGCMVAKSNAVKAKSLLRSGKPNATQALCQDLTNLAPTVAFLAAPPATATVGEVRGALDKLDSTWQAVHDRADVPDDEDDALLAGQQDYRDVLEGVGDDDSFAPYLPATAGIAQGLAHSYEAVRVRLVCPAYLQPG